MRALEYVGGVPGRVRYDNLKDAVVRILRGRNRQESERFIALRSHYGFDSFFCRPGIDGAHEKGGVENEVGRFRRTHLLPLPHAASLAELNDRLHALAVTDLGRVMAGRRETVGQCPPAAGGRRAGEVGDDRCLSYAALGVHHGQAVAHHQATSFRACGRYQLAVTMRQAGWRSWVVTTYGAHMVGMRRSWRDPVPSAG